MIAGAIKNGSPPTYAVVADQIQRIADDLRSTVVKSLASEIQKTSRGLELSTAIDRAEKIVARKWKTRPKRWGMIPGKQAMSRLSAWSQNTYGVSLSTINVAREMAPAEIDVEVAAVIRAIEGNRAFAT